MRYILTLATICFLYSYGYTQSLSSIPDNTHNERFGTLDVFDEKVVRPALTFRGFDNTRIDNENFGLGLKQVLELYLSNDDETIAIITNLKNLASASLIIPTGDHEDKIGKVNANTLRLQAKAFIALITLILEQNGENTEALLGTTHSAALLNFKNSITSLPSGNDLTAMDIVTTNHESVDKNFSDFVINVGLGLVDPVKIPRSISNIARTLDLYLALENAYDYYSSDTINASDNQQFATWYNTQTTNTPLLTKAQRESLFERFGKDLQVLYKFNTAEIGDLNDIFDGGGVTGFIFGTIIDQVSSAIDLQFHELQPGNYSFKIFLSIGYASLGMNEYVQNHQKYYDYFDMAFKTAFEFESQNRTLYWSYQTSDGDEYWAEGPHYLFFTLRDLIPFWHSVRSMNFYNSNTDLISWNGLNTEDPFFSTKYTTPLRWFADISTPDGQYPPLDDGNKKKIHLASIMNWDSNYGDSYLGESFARIHNTNDSRDDNLILYELVIPENSTTEEMEDITLFNDGDQFNVEDNDQQLLVRKQVGNEQHYVLLNAEKGNAITRAEGHEQPDNMQLLYYVDGTSYLMDAGYDGGTVSSWNGYKYHNNARFSDPEPNLYSPTEGWTQLLDFKPRYVIDDHSSGLTVGEQFGKITALSSNQFLHMNSDLDHPSGYILKNGNYSRKVLFIENNDNSYIVDLNSIIGRARLYENITQANCTPYSDPNIIGPDPCIDEIENSTNFTDVTNTTGFSYDLKYHIGTELNASNLTINGKYWSKFSFTGKDLYIYTDEINNQNILPQLGSLQIEETENNPITARTVNYRLNAGLGGQFNMINIIRRSDSNPLFSPERVFINNPNYELWTYKIDDNTVDLIFKGKNAKPIGPVTIQNNSLNFGMIEINSTDFAFGRFSKINGQWEFNPDYNVNMSEHAYSFTSNRTISSQVFIDKTLFIADNVTVMIEAEVSMINTEVLLGKDARIEVRNGGRLITDGTTFKRLDPAKQFKGIYLYTYGNSMYNSTIEGGYYGVYALNSDNNRFENTVFQNNVYGMRLWSSDSDIIGSTFKNNLYDGLLSFNSNVNIDPNLPGNGGAGGSYTRSTFEGNGDNAISAMFSSSISIYNSDFDGNDGHDIKLDSGSRVYMGYYNNPFLYFGNNNFGSASSSRKYVYSMALTTSGESSTQWTVPARKNYWNGDMTPSSSKFHGTVDYQFPLSDPAEVLPPSEGGCTQHPCMSANTQQFEYILSSGVAQNQLNEGITEIELDDVQRVKVRLNQIIERINQSNFNPRIARWMRTAYGLIDQIEDKSLIESEIERIRDIRRVWLVRFNKLNSLEISDSLSQLASTINFNQELSNNRGLGARRKISATQLIGEYLVALEMERAQNKGNHARVTNLYSLFGSYIKNKDMQNEVLGILLLSKVDNGEFGYALGILEEIEQIQPDQNMSANWEAADFETLRQDLHQWVEEANQEIHFKKAVSKNQQELEDLPNGFSIDQAYPNPFNPNTVIPFKLSQPGKVKIEVFDVTGRMVSVLTNQNYQIGSHSVHFNATNLASGTYLVRSEILGHITTQQITLIK